MTTLVETDVAVHVRQVIRERLTLSSEADFSALVGEIVDDLPEEMLREALRVALPRLAADEVRSLRRGSLKGTAPASSKWDAVREGLRAHGDIFRERVQVGGVWRFLGDLTREDVSMVVEDYRERARENEAYADCYERLGALMRRHRAGTVSALGEDRVHGAFNA